LARSIEPTSKIDAERVLTETGVAAASYRTVKRRLPVIAKPAVRQSLSAACAAHAGLVPVVCDDTGWLACLVPGCPGMRNCWKQVK